MDVTKDNFIELLQEITETIENCEFIAIDTELSGLMREKSNHRFDLPEERFAKTVDQSKGYFIMQFGLSCFSRVNQKEYDNRTYNFYIFPQATEQGNIDRTFSLQTNAIQFLSEHNFDFNKLYRQGVSYLTFQEKQQLTAKLKTDLKKAGDSIVPQSMAIMNLERERQKKELIRAKGFLEVLELVILNKKPIVGHNLFLDLIQIINQFMEPLDNDYTSFKSICHSLFPTIYDTKYIAHTILKAETLVNNQSRLNDLFCQCRDSKTLPNITINHQNATFDNEQLPHQAGYDAFMSGYCFLSLSLAYLKAVNKSLDSTKSLSVAQDSEIVDMFANRIYFPYSYDYKYFNLNGDEETPDRSHVFYVEHPSKWLTEDFFSAFSKYGGINFNRLNRTSALCILRDPEFAGPVMDYAKQIQKENRNFSIHTYEKYLELYKHKVNQETD